MDTRVCAENAYANKVATSIARYDNFQLDYPGQRGKSVNTQYPLLYSAPSRTTFPPTDSSLNGIYSLAGAATVKRN